MSDTRITTKLVANASWAESATFGGLTQCTTLCSIRIHWRSMVIPYLIRSDRLNGTMAFRFVPLSWRYTVIVCDTVSNIDIASPTWDCDGGHPVVLGHDQPSARNVSTLSRKFSAL